MNRFSLKWYPFFALALTVGVSGCTSTSTAPTVINAGALVAPLVLTEKQKEPCVAPEAKVGDDKLSLIVKSEIEIEDCEYKRAALVKTIEEKNASIEATAKSELNKIKK